MPDDRLAAELAAIRLRRELSEHGGLWRPTVAQIDAAQDDVPRLLAAVEQVIEEHGPSRAILNPDRELRYCTFDGFVYPCPTVVIVRGALFGEDGTDGS